MSRNVAFYSQEKSANKEIKGISRWPDLPHILNIFSYSQTSKLVSKIHVICEVLDLITISNTKKSHKMTIVEVVIKFITTYQLSCKYRLGVKLCWGCCCCSSSEETSPQQPHWLVQLKAGSSFLLSQYSYQKWHWYAQVARFAPGPICPTLPYAICCKCVGSFCL